MRSSRRPSKPQSLLASAWSCWGRAGWCGAWCSCRSAHRGAHRLVIQTKLGQRANDECASAQQVFDTRMRADRSTHADHRAIALDFVLQLGRELGPGTGLRQHLNAAAVGDIVFGLNAVPQASPVFAERERRLNADGRRVDDGETRFLGHAKSLMFPARKKQR